MKGIVTVDDIVDVVQEEATEDAQKFGGIEALDMPYLQSSRARHDQEARRAGSTILLVGEMLTATALGFFQKRARHGDRARAVPAAHHLERRQLRLAGLDARHSRDGARRGPRRRLVAACCAASS